MISTFRLEEIRFWCSCSDGGFNFFEKIYSFVGEFRFFFVSIDCTEIYYSTALSGIKCYSRYDVTK